jgi:hypothetical protein
LQKRLLPAIALHRSTALFPILHGRPIMEAGSALSTAEVVA